MDQDLQAAARQIVEIVPLVMRSLAAEVRKSLGDLAEHEQISLPTVSRSISTLEDRGWARRQESSRDRRVVLGEITQEGEAVLGSLQSSAERRVLEMLGPLSAEEITHLKAGLPVLRKVFEHGLACETKDS
jgi:DNA-binding MarR family transcriptional regulator